MVLKTEKKEVEINLKIKDIIKLTKKYDSENLHKIFFTSLITGNLDFLTSMLEAFGYSDNEKAFSTSNDACDFLDVYMKESSKSIANVYEDLAKEINDSGFFMKKMSEKELKDEMIGTLGIDTDKMIQTMVEEAFQKKMMPTIENQFKGYKA